jgi:tetratricopeptide (TPR) repeat protein
VLTKGKIRSGFVVLTIFIFGLLFFCKSWSNPFVFDDIIKIQENADLKPGVDLWRTLVYPYDGGVSGLRNDPSRPLVTVVNSLCYRAGDGRPWPFHFANTLFHILNAVLVFLIAGLFRKRLSSAEGPLWPQAVAALIYLLLPINAGSVVYAYALSDILATFLLMSALYLGVREEEISVRSGLLSLFLFALALLAKQSAVAFIALVPMTDLALKRSFKKRRIYYLGFLTLALVYIGARFLTFGGIGDLEAAHRTFAPWEYFSSQGLMILKYLKLTLVPVGFALDHAILPGDYGWPAKSAAWFLVVTVLAVSLVFLRRRKARAEVLLIAWAFSFFALALLPVSSILPTADLFVERRAYLPDIAVAVALGILLAAGSGAHGRWFRSFRAAGPILVLTLIAAVSWNRTLVYSSPELLWRESLRRYPNSHRARINLGTVDYDAGKYDEAKSLFESVARDFPADAFAYAKLALIYQNPRFRGHDVHVALAAYEKSLSLAPDDIVTLYNFAALLVQMGDYERAEAVYRRILSAQPRFAYARSGLGRVLIKRGKIAEGVAALKEALALDPQVPGARELLRLYDR